MPESLSDVVIGSLFFFTLLVLAVLGGGLLQRIAKSRNGRALATLAPLVNGSLHSDHKAAWMHGQYRGQTVQVRMTPGKNIGQSSDTTIRINSFEILFPGIEGTKDWQVAHQGVLRKQWVTSASDERLRSKIAGSDLVARLHAAGNHPLLRYDAREQVLLLHEDVQPRLAPEAEQFRSRLELMLHAARVNAEMNPPRL